MSLSASMEQLHPGRARSCCRRVSLRLAGVAIGVYNAAAGVDGGAAGSGWRGSQRECGVSSISAGVVIAGHWRARSARRAEQSEPVSPSVSLRRSTAAGAARRERKQADGVADEQLPCVRCGV